MQPPKSARVRGVSLVRRGVRHGTVAPVAIEPVGRWNESRFLAECERRWAGDLPIVLPGAVAASLTRRRRAVEAALDLFARARAGESFESMLHERLDPRRFAAAGATIDAGDTRELEKVFVHALSKRRTVARDLYAKLSWIAHDERDSSLRIRFSFGSEALLDWQRETRRAPWSEAFAAAAFPECAAITGRRPLVALVERLIGTAPRFSERIIYNNAPGGGAHFHHDDEEHQLGVLFSQLEGETAWFALPKRQLAEFVAEFARGSLARRAGTAHKALRALDDTCDEELSRLLNSTPRFTRALAEVGTCFHLRAGDSILLPTHGPDDTCWHSVYGLGARPSLAHSYGIFAARRPVKRAVRAARARTQ
ncbi:MAG: hypothetical protein FJ298_13785 [Planctomycetes bacterium]|nr:hypothetical protein [Planctomycetota bacterium]